MGVFEGDAGPEGAIGGRGHSSCWSVRTPEAEYVQVSLSSLRRMVRSGVKPPEAMTRRGIAAVGGQREGRSQLHRWVETCGCQGGGLGGYRASQSAGLARAAAVSPWWSRSLRASSRIRTGKGLPIADDPRPPTEPLAGVARAERRRVAFRLTRPEPPPTMPIQISIFGGSRHRPAAAAPFAAIGFGSGAC
jgi:hypothetical protein